jgi:hypothetical protein
MLSIYATVYGVLQKLSHKKRQEAI